MIIIICKKAVLSSSSFNLTCKKDNFLLVRDGREGVLRHHEPFSGLAASTSCFSTHLSNFYQHRIIFWHYCDLLPPSKNLFIGNFSWLLLMADSEKICLGRIREDINEKKTCSFGHCPNHLNPPPWPEFRQLGPLFSEVEIQDLKISLELRILYILYNILHISNLKNS